MRKSIDMERLTDFDGITDDNGEPLVVSIIELYLDMAPNLLEKILKDIESQDIAAINRNVHNLKSSSANVGAVVLAEMCLDLESKTKAGATPSAATLKTLGAQITVEYAKVKIELAAIVGASSLRASS